MSCLVQETEQDGVVAAMLLAQRWLDVDSVTMKAAAARAAACTLVRSPVVAYSTWVANYHVQLGLSNGLLPCHTEPEAHCRQIAIQQDAWSAKSRHATVREAARHVCRCEANGPRESTVRLLGKRAEASTARPRHASLQRMASGTQPTTVKLVPFATSVTLVRATGVVRSSLQR